MVVCMSLKHVVITLKGGMAVNALDYLESNGVGNCLNTYSSKCGSRNRIYENVGWDQL